MYQAHIAEIPEITVPAKVQVLPKSFFPEVFTVRLTGSQRDFVKQTQVGTSDRIPIAIEKKKSIGILD
jgi:hypothetical protein